jgi:hypothetical protein
MRVINPIRPRFPGWFKTGPKGAAPRRERGAPRGLAAAPQRASIPARSPPHIDLRFACCPWVCRNANATHTFSLAHAPNPSPTTPPQPTTIRRGGVQGVPGPDALPAEQGPRRRPPQRRRHRHRRAGLAAARFAGTARGALCRRGALRACVRRRPPARSPSPPPPPSAPRSLPRAAGPEAPCPRPRARVPQPPNPPATPLAPSSGSKSGSPGDPTLPPAPSGTLGKLPNATARAPPLAGPGALGPPRRPPRAAPPAPADAPRPARAAPLARREPLSRRCGA